MVYPSTSPESNDIQHQWSSQWFRSKPPDSSHLNRKYRFTRNSEGFFDDFGSFLYSIRLIYPLAFCNSKIICLNTFRVLANRSPGISSLHWKFPPVLNKNILINNGIYFLVIVAWFAEHMSVLWQCFVCSASFY